jgi:hypothetical protein
MMVAKTSIYYDIITEFQNKGAKQAETSFASLQKKAVTLAKAFGLAFGAKEIISFGKAAVNMAAQENKQFTVLGNTLKNIGLGFASVDAKSFIESTALATGTAIDTLIPAYQNLLVATGDVTKSQDALQTAMDVSAATGKDLATVTTAIAKGYTGNTTALTRLGAGLDKTLLKTGRMDLIMKQLATTFKGDAAIAADTTAGKMARLGEAARQATVQIGEGLITAFSELTAGGSITNATNQIVAFGKTIGDAIAGIGDLITAIKKVPYAGDLFSKVFKAIGNTSTLSVLIKGLAKLHENTVTSVGAISPTVQAAIDQGNAQAQAKALALKAKQLAAEKAILSTQKAQTLEQKNQALLKILGSTSQDFERANLMAALAHAQTQEVKDQLQYQLDLLDATNQTGAAQAKTIDNAIILKEKMLLAQGQVMLVDGSIVNLSEAKNPFAGFDKYVQDALNAILKLNQAIVTLPQPFVGFTGANNYGGLAGDSGTYGFGNPTTTVSPTDGSSTTGFVGNNNYGGLGGSTGFGNASSTTSSINLNLSLDSGLIISTTNASTANGSPVTINRLSNQFASV